MTNFMYAFNHYYNFGSISSTMKNMVKAIRQGKLKKSVAVRILRQGLTKDFYYDFNKAQVEHFVSEFEGRLNNG